MAVTIGDLKQFLAPLDDDLMIGVDESGLTLAVYVPNASLVERIDADTGRAAQWFELGGVNLDDDDDDTEGIGPASQEMINPR